MIQQPILIGLAAGFISAVVFVSAVTGLSLMHVLLFLFSPLVLFLTAFGAGTIAAVVASLVAAALIFVVGLQQTPAGEAAQLALVFVALEALPVLVLTHLASLNRDWDGATDWYPIGRIVMAAALIAAALSIVSLLRLGAELDSIHAAIRSVTEKFVAERVPKISGAPTLTAEDIDAIAREAVQMMPSLISFFVMVCLLLNMWIAGRITLASGRLARPWPDLSAISYPRSTPLLLLGASLVAWSGGYIGLCAKALLTPLVLAYVLLTLAILHYVTRGSAWRPFVLWGIYLAPIVLLILLAGSGLQLSLWPIAIVLALPGLAETAWPIRKLPASSNT